MIEREKRDPEFYYYLQDEMRNQRFIEPAIGRCLVTMGAQKVGTLRRTMWPVLLMGASGGNPLGFLKSAKRHPEAVKAQRERNQAQHDVLRACAPGKFVASPYLCLAGRLVSTL